MKLWHITHRKNLQSILKKGLIIRKRGKPSFTGTLGQDIRQHKACIHAWEHSSDALNFAYGVGGWQSDDYVLLAFSSDAETIVDPYCECQENARAVVIKEPVPSEKIEEVYFLTKRDYYKSHYDQAWQHKNVPIAEPSGNPLITYLWNLRQNCKKKMKRKRHAVKNKRTGYRTI